MEVGPYVWLRMISSSIAGRIALPLQAHQRSLLAHFHRLPSHPSMSQFHLPKQMTNQIPQDDSQYIWADGASHPLVYEVSCISSSVIGERIAPILVIQGWTSSWLLMNWWRSALARIICGRNSNEGWPEVAPWSRRKTYKSSPCLSPGQTLGFKVLPWHRGGPKWCRSYCCAIIQVPLYLENLSSQLYFL